MKIKQTKVFNTISERIIYGLNFLYSEFVPTKSEKVDEIAQQKLHKLMGRMIDMLYDTPEFLNLVDAKDEAFEWYATNNTNPELDMAYKSVFKGIYDFYKFLYISFLHGQMMENRLTIDNKILSKNQVSYRLPYKIFLNELGINVEKGKAETIFTADSDILRSLNLLAEKTPVNINRWTPYSLINFACCSFTGDFNFLLTRVDDVLDLNGLLLEIENNCIKNDYNKSIDLNFGPSGFGFNISFQNKVGGFIIGYNPRKYWQFYFGSLNSIGVKAMLEDFENLDVDLQKHLINVCKTCNGCLGCTKGGKNKIFATKVEYDGKEYNLCNDNYSRHNWEKIDRDLASVLFKYHAAQEIYGSNWKNK